MCVDKQELASLVSELRELKTIKSELDDQVKDIERKIVDYMDENGKEKEVGVDFQITYREQTRKIWDNDKLIPVLGTDLDAFKKTSTFMALKIK